MGTTSVTNIFGCFVFEGNNFLEQYVSILHVHVVHVHQLGSTYHCILSCPLGMKPKVLKYVWYGCIHAFVLFVLCQSKLQKLARCKFNSLHENNIGTCISRGLKDDQLVYVDEGLHMDCSITIG